MDRVGFRELVVGLRAPLIIAPMWGVSTPRLTRAAIEGGVIGAFPTSNAADIDALDAWLAGCTQCANQVGATAGVAAPNLVLRGNRRLEEELDCISRHRPGVVITSVGSPAAVIGPLHRAGTFVLADVATLHHAERALEAGADGLVLLTAGAGGQTGWANPFAFVRSVRARTDAPLVLAGGVGDGIALHAAITLGCDLAYMGTRFLATDESAASPRHKRSVVESEMDDIRLATSPMGLPTNYIASSLGEDPVDGSRRRGYTAGHSAFAATAVMGATPLIAEIVRGYRSSMANTLTSIDSVSDTC